MGNAPFEMLTLYVYSFHISPFSFFFFLLLVINTHTFFPLRKHILDITDYVVLIRKKMNVAVENGQGKKQTSRTFP